MNGMTDDDGYLVADKDFTTSQARAVWEAISACWSAEIYIPDLSHRFWRLTLQVSFSATLPIQHLPHDLQLLSRYKTWLDQALAGADESPTRTNAAYPAKERVRLFICEPGIYLRTMSARRLARRTVLHVDAGTTERSTVG